MTNAHHTCSNSATSRQPVQRRVALSSLSTGTKDFALATLWIFVALSSGCAGPYRIGELTETYDDFKQISVNSIAITPKTKLMRVIEKDGLPAYIFSVNNIYMSDQPASFNELIFIADGTHVVLSGVSKLINAGIIDAGAWLYEERAAFPVTERQLAIISGSRDVSVRLYGRSKSADPQTLSPESLGAIREFVKRFVITSPSPTK